MADRTDNASFDPKTWVSEPAAPAVVARPSPAQVSPASSASGGRIALAFGLSTALLLGGAAAAYLTRAPALAAALR